MSVYRQPSNNANGNTRDRQGRLVTCEHDTRRVTRTDTTAPSRRSSTGSTANRSNSPNDVVRSIRRLDLFTDPPFGILGNYEGHVATAEQPTNVYGSIPVRPRDGGDSRVNRAERACLLADEELSSSKRV